MAPEFENRPVYAYVISGHTADGVLDYEEFFRDLAALAPGSRQTELRGDVVAITDMAETGRGWAMRFLNAQSGLPPLTFDPETQEERYENLGDRLLAYTTQVIVRPEARLVAIERRRPGVPVQLIARGLSAIGREALDFSRLTISLTPVPSQSFRQEIEKFERIREAAVVLTRPNLDWSDHVGPLTRYGAESRAGRVSVEMSAQRGESLDPDEGIVADIKNFAAQSGGMAEDLRVTGRRAGEDRETSVSLLRHHARRFVRLVRGAPDRDEREVIADAADALFDDVDNAAVANLDES
ncbi:UNVERIFIED_ORG: hypothetical protein E4P37_17565 [Bacillus sp. AZ43]